MEWVHYGMEHVQNCSSCEKGTTVSPCYGRYCGKVEQFRLEEFKLLRQEAWWKVARCHGKAEADSF